MRTILALLVVVLLLASGAPLGAYASKTESAPVIILTPANTVILSGHIDPDNLADVIEEIKYKPTTEYLVIMSYGGNIANLELFAAKVSSYPKIKVLVISAASAAAAISQMVLNERLIVPTGELLFHRVKFAQDGYHEAKDLIAWANEMKLVDEEFAKQCLKRMKVAPDVYDANTIGKDWIITSREALSIGAVEQIRVAKCDAELRKMDIRVNLINMINYKDGYANICDVINPLDKPKVAPNVPLKKPGA